MGKYEVAHKRESIYTMGFLHTFWSTVFLAAYGFFFGEWVFAMASLPTFLLRCALEIALVFVSLHAIITADRSTFAFLRTTTIPLLLGADIFLGYTLTIPQLAGISLMVLAFVFLSLNHGLSRKGKMLSLFSALIPVGTLTLYKYNISNFNSVEAEQALLHGVTLVAFIVGARMYTKENLFASLLHPRYFLQSVIAGIGSVFLSFAYVFAPASVITAAKRAFEILGAIVSGQTYFKEKHVIIKLISCTMIVGGVVLMAV